MLGVAAGMRDRLEKEKVMISWRGRRGKRGNLRGR